MKFLALLILGVAAVLELELTAAAEIDCYWCFGFLYDRNVSKYENTKACTLESFDKNQVKVVHNTTDDEHGLACVTVSVWIKDLNHDEPVTARGAVQYRSQARPVDVNVLDAGLFDDDVVDVITRAPPEHPMYIGIELCFENLCNTHTYHRSSASTFSVSGIFFLLLPAFALRYSM